MRHGVSARTAVTFALLLGATVVSAGAGALGVSSRDATTTTTVAPLAAGDYTEYLTMPSRTREFILHVPPDVSASDPLVLVYPGAGTTAADVVAQTNFESVADQDGEVVAFMQGWDDTWNEGAGDTPARQAGVNDVVFTAAVIVRVGDLVPFDHASVAAVGTSNGALMVEDLGCKLADELTLIVPVEGEIPVSVAATCHPSRPLSVYEIHGTADASIPYSGGHFDGIGGGTTVLSAPKSISFWAGRDGCASRATLATPSAGIELSVFHRCRDGVHVTLRTIVGGQHSDPPNLAELVYGALGS